MSLAKVILTAITVLALAACGITPGPTYAGQGYRRSADDQLLRCTATGMSFDACCENHPDICE